MESCLDAIKSKDDMIVEMFSGLGIVLGKMLMPKIMKKGLIEAYFESGAVRVIHLYIDGKEITDGVNYNQYCEEGIKVNLRVWWIRNPPNKAEYFSVSDIVEAIKKIKELAEKDLGDSKIISNASGLEILEDGEWLEYLDEEQQTIDEIMRVNGELGRIYKVMK